MSDSLLNISMAGLDPANQWFSQQVWMTASSAATRDKNCVPRG